MNTQRKKFASNRTSLKNTNTEGNGLQSTFNRRSFLQKGLVGASTVAVVGLTARRAEARNGLTPGDAAILRFLAAAEILETDAWQQYNELGGIQDREVPGGGGNAAYKEALAVLDEDMDQYIHDNTEDEFTHFGFINAYRTGWHQPLSIAGAAGHA